jgi:hypothetical protein
MTIGDIDLLMLGFIKYGKLEHLQSLQMGNLYCNPIQYFAKCDETDGIGDKYETITKQTFGKTATLNINDGDLNRHLIIVRDPGGNNQNLLFDNEFYANLFCLYSVNSNNSQTDGFEYKSSLPVDMVKVYGHMLIIRDTVAFVQRVVKRLADLKLEHRRGLIEYIDFTNFEGRKTYFQKPLKYRDQNEYRIMIKNTVEQPMIIDIGSIKDISEIYTVEEVKRVRVFVGI